MTTQQILSRLISHTSDELVQSALLDSLYAVRRLEWSPTRYQPFMDCAICGGTIHTTANCSLGEMN